MDVNDTKLIQYKIRKYQSKGRNMILKLRKKNKEIPKYLLQMFFSDKEISQF
jgi:hypothetical protein